MRCKCRGYVYLLVGILFGTMVSSLLQIFAMLPIDSRELQLSIARQGGGNLENGLSKKDSLQREMPIIQEDHRSRRSAVDEDNPDEQEQKTDEEISNDIKELPLPVTYGDRNLQRRNMQNLHTDNEAPIIKLTDELATRKSLLIAVITSVQQLMSQTIAIHGTWAKEEKNVVYFVGDVKNMPHLPHGMEVKQLEGIDDKQATLEMKEMAVFKYIVNHYSEEVDWYLVITDDTYVKPKDLRQKLEILNPSLNVYMGNRQDSSLLCNPSTGVLYSRGLLSRLDQYLPQCLGEGLSIGNCILQRGIYCTRAQEIHDLMYIDQKRILETSALYDSKEIIKRALTLYPIRYPKFMYRLYSFVQEINLNDSMADASHAVDEIQVTSPFVPTHLRSSFKPSKVRGNCSIVHDDSFSKTTKTNPANLNIRPRYKPRNKFELNTWDYFNQTRLMSVNSEQPSHGILGGLREEARFMLTKGISVTNQGLSANEKLVFDKLENGYRRVDPMRGSEYIFDFVFKKNIDKSKRVRKRVVLLRPFHEVIVPIDSPQSIPTINFITTLSGLSERLEQFLKTYEKNILLTKEKASLTISLYKSPDAEKVRQIISKYSSLYPQAGFNIVDVEGTFARGIGLHRATEQFQDNDLMFFVDIDLEIGPEFLRRARLNAIKGKQVYFPIFFKLYNTEFVNKHYKGNSSQLLSRHHGHWAHYSFGMVVVYAGDYKKVGGFDISMKGWGEEDVDFFRKVLSHDMEVFRAPDPGLIHLWHPKICNEDTVVTQEAHFHCLQSKAENLADRVELAHFVFTELKAGNTL